MYTYTIVCYGTEIATGTGQTFEAAKRDAKEQLGPSEWYPESDWGYICIAPNGMIVSYNL